MRMRTHKQVVTFSTRGFGDIVNLSDSIMAFLREIHAKDGLLTVFVPGSTAAITTIEYESGVLEDLKASISRLIPRDIPYRHDVRWGDGNGFAHVQAAWFGPSLTVPVEKGHPLLGTWQQVILLDFDNRPRSRKVVLHFLEG